jgi:hypothetical protein
MLTVNLQAQSTLFHAVWKALRSTMPIINQIVAYMCIIVFALYRYFHIPHIQEAAILSLGFILLNGFFALEKAISDRPRRRSFKNIVEARNALFECMKDAFKRDGYVEVEWLGMTMLNVFGIVKLVFEDLRENVGVKDLRWKVRMLDGNWLSNNIINSAWTKERGHTSMVNMVVYFEGLVAKGLTSVKCEISHYDHMPCIHGGLINGKYLFLGISQWRDGNLHAGESRYYLYTFKDADDLEKIEFFRNWFEYCNKDPKVCVPSAPAGAIPVTLAPKAATA